MAASWCRSSGARFPQPERQFLGRHHHGAAAFCRAGLVLVGRHHGAGQIRACHPEVMEEGQDLPVGPVAAAAAREAAPQVVQHGALAHRPAVEPELDVQPGGGGLVPSGTEVVSAVDQNDI